MHQRKEQHLEQVRQPQTAKLSPIHLRPSAKAQDFIYERGRGGRGWKCEREEDKIERMQGITSSTSSDGEKGSGK